MEPLPPLYVTPEEMNGYMRWPDNSNWSWQFLRVVAQAPVGGADFTECDRALAGVESGDADGWYEAFAALAQDLDERAREAADAGHDISAARKWLRASNYYRAAGFFHLDWANDERAARAVDGRRRCFQEFAARADLLITPVEIPYEHGTSLPGYLMLPTPGTATPLPAAVVMGGGDAFAEEMYFDIGRALADRGYAVLLFDGPGQGEALRRGIYARHDFEVPIGATIDFLVARDDIDPERIAVVSESLGGYYATRAAAFEPRLAACVNSGGPYEFPELVFQAEDFHPTQMAITGKATIEEAHAELRRFTLEGVVGRIRCPVLLLAGQAEVAFLYPVGKVFDANAAYNTTTLRIYEEIPHDDKRIILYPMGAPGSTHCQHDSLVALHDDVGDWLDEVLAR